MVGWMEDIKIYEKNRWMVGWIGKQYEKNIWMVGWIKYMDGWMDRKTNI